MKRLALVIALLLAASCSDAPAPTGAPAEGSGAGGTSSSTTAAVDQTPAGPADGPEQEPPSSTAAADPAPAVPEELPDGMEVDVVGLDAMNLTIAVADTFELRRLGLMFVDDLLDLDGMLFVFEEDTATGFWMKNTLLSLDIAFFDGEGRVVDRMVMEPCAEEPCRVYTPSGEYRYALEMLKGTMPLDPQLLTYQD